MDLFVNSYKTEELEPTLDFEVTSNGELNFISGEEEVKQRAIVSAFTQKGTIPQLPETGVQWAELIVGKVTPSEINSQILSNIHECADTYGYIPQYSSLNNNLVVTIGQGV